MKIILTIALIAILIISTPFVSSASVTAPSSVADSSSFAGEIKIAVFLTGKQRSPFTEIFKKFSKEIGIKITTVARRDADYKEYLPV